MRSKRAQGVRVILLLSMRVWRPTVRSLPGLGGGLPIEEIWRDRRSLSAWYLDTVSTFGGNLVERAAANVVVKRLMEEGLPTCPRYGR